MEKDIQTDEKMDRYTNKQQKHTGVERERERVEKKKRMKLGVNKR